MKDATRQEAMDWCISNKVDFKKGHYPPPPGWIWYKTKDCTKSLISVYSYACNGDNNDIEDIDVFVYWSPCVLSQKELANLIA